MAVTVRGVTYTAALPGAVALPAGTVAGDLMILALYRYGNDPTYYFPQPDDSSITYYSIPGLVINGWQRLDGQHLGVAAWGIYFRTVLAADITAGTITAGNTATAAALITFTGDHLMLFPSDWNTGLGGDLAPMFISYSEMHYVSGGQATNTYAKVYPATQIYLGLLSDADATAAINTSAVTGGTTLLNAPGTQHFIASYGHINTRTPVTITMTSAIPLDWSPTTFTGAALTSITIREIDDPVTDGADDFADAKLITLAADGDTYISPVISNYGYTTEPGEPLHRIDNGDSTYDDVGYRTAWWKYTPATSGTITVDTSLSPGDGYADTTMSVYTGESLDNLTEVAFDDNSGGYHDSLITLDVDNGRTYYIKVGNWLAQEHWLYCLRLTGPASGEPAPITNITLACPPITVPTVVLAYDPLPSPDNFVDANTVKITTTGGTYTSAASDNVDFTIETGEPYTAYNPYLRRTAWWKFTPLHAGNVTVTTTGSTPSEGDLSLELRAYTGTVLSDLVKIAEDRTADHDPAIASTTFYAHAGHTYYLQIGDNSGSSGSAGVVLTATGPNTHGDPTVIVDAAPIQVDVTALPVALIRLAVGNPVPATDTVVPVVRPVFAITIVRSEPEPVEVTVHVFITQGVTAIDNFSNTFQLSYPANIVTLTAPTDLPPGSYEWAFSVDYGGHVVYQQSGLSFTVAGSGQASTTVAVTWTVAGSIPAPHLWFVRPAAGAPGDQITAVGQGAATGTVTVAGQAATSVTFTQIAATGATTDRVINPTTGVVDAEHFQAVFTVPDIAAPGGPVVITS